MNYTLLMNTANLAVCGLFIWFIVRLVRRLSS